MMNNNPINTEKEIKLTKKEDSVNNILDLDGEIEEVSIEEENKKINDSKSIMQENFYHIIIKWVGLGFQ